MIFNMENLVNFVPELELFERDVVRHMWILHTIDEWKNVIKI